jgi:transcription elongation factor GreA
VTETAATTWLTQDAYDRLKGELDELSGPARIAIAKKIELAREEGDLRENGGYHAAKEEQGKMEARIRQLTQLLNNATVGAPPSTGGKAGPGMVVTVKYADGDTERFLIGSREDRGTSDIEVYSANSPLGKALTGTKPGDAVSYALPSGKEISVTLVDVEPFTG